MARVSRCLRGWSAASSGLMTPRRTCSAGHEWSCEMSLTLPLRNRYAGLSPTFTRPSSPARMATTTMVLPIPSHAGFPFAASSAAECVLTDCDAVAVVQLFLLDGLAVHQRAIGAAEVYDPELLASPLDAGVMSTGRRVAEDQVVVGRAADAERSIAGAVVVAGVRTRLDGQLRLRSGA